MLDQNFGNVKLNKPNEILHWITHH
jgi:hypothetical protein